MTGHRCECSVSARSAQPQKNEEPGKVKPRLTLRLRHVSQACATCFLFMGSPSWSEATHLTGVVVPAAEAILLRPCLAARRSFPKAQRRSTPLRRKRGDRGDWRGTRQEVGRQEERGALRRNAALRRSGAEMRGGGRGRANAHASTMPARRESGDVRGEARSDCPSVLPAVSVLAIALAIDRLCA